MRYIIDIEVKLLDFQVFCTNNITIFYQGIEYCVVDGSAVAFTEQVILADDHCGT